jgi:hypothetical protein
MSARPNLSQALADGGAPYSPDELIEANDQVIFLDRAEIDLEIERLHFETKVFLETVAA